MAVDPVLVVGGGPAGLAAAAALHRRGIPALVLERSDAVGASWRRHYERLHLHTTRNLSHLGGLRIPRRFGRWVARDDVVAYLEQYVEHHHLRVQTGVEVTRISQGDDGRWLLETSHGVMSGREVVVATGINHTPVPPRWPGTFDGEVVYAAEYRNAAPYVGRDVLVVGVGNTGAEIAVDLTEGGASRVRLAVRTPPHIVRRSNFGWPAQGTGIVVRRMPVRMVDAVAALIARVEVPDLSSYGLPRPTTGLYTRVIEGALPLQDVGLIAAVQAGTVEPVPTVTAFDGPAVVLADGSRIEPEIVLLATGYRPGLDAVVGDLGVLDDHGVPARTLPGLYFAGFTHPISGMLRELRLDARRIARAVSRRRSG